MFSKSNIFARREEGRAVSRYLFTATKTAAQVLSLVMDRVGERVVRFGGLYRVIKIIASQKVERN